MRKLITAFVKYPFYANTIIFILLVAGIFSFLQMKKSFFPERISREINVRVFYPGASPKEMEEGITVRIEEAVRGIVGIKEINSSSSENLTSVTITTNGEYNIDETLYEIKNAIDGISSFPSAAEKPIIYKRRSVTSVLFMGLTGKADLMSLKSIAREIEEDLLLSGKVTQVNVSGFPPTEISIEVPENNLMRYKLTFDEIIHAVSQNNRDISAGQIKSEDEEILIRSRKRSIDPSKIGNIILRANPNGSFLKIRDIGTVKIKFSEISSKGLLNGEEVVFFSIKKLPEEDLEEISEYCNNYVKKFNSEHEGIQLHITFDFLNILKSRIDLLTSNGIIGLLLVLVALGLFLSFRLSLWVAWGIPASFLGMFIAANIAGVTINMLSLFGMILVIGILVDDGIVIAENIYYHFEKGKKPRIAAVDGTLEVLPAVMVSVLTTIIAFAPLMLIKNGSMEIMGEVAFVVIACLAFSLIEAFFILPSHVGHPSILKKEESNSANVRIRKFLDKRVLFMRNKIYGKILKFSIRWRWAMLIIPFALIIISMGLIQGELIKFTFFPAITFDSFQVNLAFTPGSGEKQTMEQLLEFEETIWEVNENLKKEYNDTNNYIKYTFLGLGNAFNGLETGSHAGNINVLLRNMEGAPISSFYIAQRVREKIGDIPEAEKFTVAGNNRFGNPVSISLLGKNMVELTEAEKFAKNEMEKIEALNNINDNNALGKQEVRIKLKPKAYFLGMNHASISNQVRQGFYGGQVQRLQEGKDELKVWVRYPKSNRLNLGQLEKMKIKTKLGEYPLNELISYDIKRGPVNIKRFNARREIRIDADLVDPYAPVPPILEKIKNDIVPKMQSKYPGVRVVYQGQQKSSTEATDDLKKYYSIAFILMVLIVMLHFKSFGQGLIILLMIPLGWLGSIWGHGIEGVPVSILSVWGMVALSGVIINDAVVFLSKFNHLLKGGYTLGKAVYKAGLSRFRPIILTTITTTIGLYPLILEKSFQAQFLIPMAVALAYGVLIGTAFILVFFPALIMVKNDIKVFFIWLFKHKWPKPEEVEKAVIYSKRIIE